MPKDGKGDGLQIFTGDRIIPMQQGTRLCSEDHGLPSPGSSIPANEVLHKLDLTVSWPGITDDFAYLVDELRTDVYLPNQPLCFQNPIAGNHLPDLWLASTGCMLKNCSLVFL